MSQLIISRLGGLPDGGLGETNPVTADLQTSYNRLRSGCIDNFGVQFCNSILPANVFNAMGRPEPQKLKWYMWLGIGYLAAKIL